jgi:hypothetical protein
MSQEFNGPLKEDLRHLLFEDAAWFSALTQHTPDMWVLWRVTKTQEQAWWRELLIAAAAFARDHDLLIRYKKAFAGIRSGDLSDSAGDRDHRSPVNPIWEIAYELIVGLFLEHGLGWRYLGHEPRGHRSHVGDWAFEAPSGRSVFVEVKSVLEPEMRGSGVFSRGPAMVRLTAVLRGAYKQLPRDSRSTMVVLAGNGLATTMAHDVMFTDLFQTLYGRMQVSMSVLPYVEGSARVGPSFYDTFANAGKHRRLGCVAGLHVAGNEQPGLVFYAIHNPYADQSSQLTSEDFGDALRFWVDEAGNGQELGDVRAREFWSKIVAGLRLR